MRARLLSTGLVMLATATTLVACNNPVYVNQRRPLGTMEDPMNANGGFTADRDLFVLPVRQPTMEEARRLNDEQMRLGLMDPIPWAAQRDFQIQIDWSLKNLEDREVTATFTINGGTEFGDYDPTMYVDPTVPENDQVVPPNLLGGTPITLEPNQTLNGLFREDELAEAGLDLEAITRYPDPANVLATPFRVLTRRASASRVGYEQIPPNDVTPAMVRYILTLGADGRVALDYGVRVRDPNGKLLRPLEPNNDEGYVSTAGTLMPPVAPPAAMMMPTP
jgi:hypothetical protein